MVQIQLIKTMKQRHEFDQNAHVASQLTQRQLVSFYV